MFGNDVRVRLRDITKCEKRPSPPPPPPTHTHGRTNTGTLGTRPRGAVYAVYRQSPASLTHHLRQSGTKPSTHLIDDAGDRLHERLLGDRLWPGRLAAGAAQAAGVRGTYPPSLCRDMGGGVREGGPRRGGGTQTGFPLPVPRLLKYRDAMKVTQSVSLDREIQGKGHVILNQHPAS